MNMHASIAAVDAERLEIVGSFERLAALAQPWTRLWRDCDGLIFQSHDWISAWWQTLDRSERSALRIGLIWNGDRLVAVMPLAISRRKGLRILEWAAVAYSDYGDILVAPECSDAALDRLWTAICDAGGFDLASMTRLLPEAAAWRVLAPGRAHGIKLRSDHRRETSARIAGDWGSGAAWLASLSRRGRRTYRKSVRILDEMGTMRFRLLDPDEPLEPVLDRLSSFKLQWLKSNGLRSDLFESETPVLAALVDVLARAGVLRLFVIELDGAPVAISVNFVQRNVMMIWTKTYDPAFARAAPGMRLTYEYIQWSIDHGLDMVDMLCGSEAYKDQLATHVVTLRSVIGARTAKGWLALLADKAYQRLRRTRRVDPVPAEPD